MKKIHTFDEVLDSQKMFRLILTALSNPSKTVNIKEFSDKLYGQAPEFLAIAMTLLDNEVRFYAGKNDELAGEIISLTLAKRAKLQDADFIFVQDAAQLQNIIENARCGTLRDPHKSALIIIKIDDLKNTSVKIFGAGIKGTLEFRTSDTVKAALDIRDAQFYEYPQGIDFIFVSDNGDLFAIPRLTMREDA